MEEPTHEVVSKTYVIVVDDGPDAGAVARFREPGVGSFAGLMDLRDDSDVDPEPLFTFVADYLVSWNLTRDGAPIPATAEGVRSLSAALFAKFLDLWMEAIGGADAPLGSPSPNGGPPAAVRDLPMEPPSQNPLSLPGST